MPAPIVAAVGATVVGGVMSSNAQKKAAKSQANAAQSAEQSQREMFDYTNQMLDPFRQMGMGNIGSLNMLANQEFDREKLLGDYYNSGEFAMMNDQSMRNVNSMNEASGNVGSSAGANSLMTIAPQLGQQHLGTMYGQQMDKFNQLNSLVSMGQNAAAMQGNAAQNFGSQAANIQMQAGNNMAQNQIAQGNNMANMVGSLGGLGYNYMQNPNMFNGSF